MGGIEGGRKEEGLYAHLRFSLFRPFFDIPKIYAEYLAHNLGSATETITNITLVDDFMTFNILNYKNYLHLSIKLQFNKRNTIYQNKVRGSLKRAYRL